MPVPTAVVPGVRAIVPSIKAWSVIVPVVDVIACPGTRGDVVRDLREAINRCNVFVVVDGMDAGAWPIDDGIGVPTDTRPLRNTGANLRPARQRDRRYRPAGRPNCWWIWLPWKLGLAWQLGPRLGCRGWQRSRPMYPLTGPTWIGQRSRFGSRRLNADRRSFRHRLGLGLRCRQRSGQIWRTCPAAAFSAGRWPKHRARLQLRQWFRGRLCDGSHAWQIRDSRRSSG